ncbi:MAG: transglycosylase SLT domain-containing protein [Gemmobacter sp.]
MAILWVAGLGQAASTEPAGVASADPAALCDAAAVAAAAETGVPLDVLRALALAETGHLRAGRLRPWAWAINEAGTGRWFPVRETAVAHARAVIAGGRRNIDVGCFQINFRWHGDAFESLEQMFDPEANARYAAAFLARLHAESGSWTAAAGAYHSRTQHLANRYRHRFEAILAALPAEHMPLAAPSPSRRPNGFPLLRPGAAARPGALVPADAGTPRSLIGPAARPLFGEG